MTKRTRLIGRTANHKTVVGGCLDIAPDLPQGKDDPGRAPLHRCPAPATELDELLDRENNKKNKKKCPEGGGTQYTGTSMPA